MLKIPNKIFQTWKTKNLPKNLLTITETWQKQNPDFEYQLYDDDDCLAFITEYYPEYLSAYLKFPIPVEKADFFRYLIVYHYGGVYTDLDTSCEQPLNRLIRDEDEVIIGLESDSTQKYADKSHWERAKVYAQWTFIARPKHPLLLDAVKMCISNSEKNLPTLEKTGPRMWTEIVMRYKNSPGVRLLSIDYFGAGSHHSKRAYKKIDDIFVLHYFFTGWKPGKERTQYDYYFHKSQSINRMQYWIGNIGFIRYWIKKRQLCKYANNFESV